MLGSMDATACICREGFVGPRGHEIGPGKMRESLSGVVIVHTKGPKEVTFQEHFRQMDLEIASRAAPVSTSTRPPSAQWV